MQEIALSAGIIEYEDTGGSGPVVVLLHGLVMDGSLWRHVVGELRSDHRCVVPTLPLGSHRQPMRADADLSPHGIARLQAEFLEALDLHDVTLVGNDLGTFQITAGWYPERIARLVLTSCEAFENFPPGLPGRAAEVGIKMPGGAFLMAQVLRLRALRRLPFTFGWMTKRPIPNEILDAWFRPLQTQPGVRRDLTKYVQTLDKGDMLVAAERLLCWLLVASVGSNWPLRTPRTVTCSLPIPQRKCTISSIDSLIFTKGGTSPVHRILIFVMWLTGYCLRSLGDRFVAWTTPESTSLLLLTLTDLVRSKSELVAENALFRQQLIILCRQVKRPACIKMDRMLLVLLASMLRTWKQALLIVQPGDALALASSGLQALLEIQVQSHVCRTQDLR